MKKQGKIGKSSLNSTKTINQKGAYKLLSSAFSKKSLQKFAK